MNESRKENCKSMRKCKEEFWRLLCRVNINWSGRFPYLTQPADKPWQIVNDSPPSNFPSSNVSYWGFSIEKKIVHYLLKFIYLPLPSLFFFVRLKNCFELHYLWESLKMKRFISNLVHQSWEKKILQYIKIWCG